MSLIISLIGQYMEQNGSIAVLGDNWCHWKIDRSNLMQYILRSLVFTRNYFPRQQTSYQIQMMLLFHSQPIGLINI